MTTKHDWREVLRYDDVKGFLCDKCDLFMKFNSQALPAYGCVEDYATMSQQDIRRELSGTEFWNEDKGDR